METKKSIKESIYSDTNNYEKKLDEIEAKSAGIAQLRQRLLQVSDETIIRGIQQWKIIANVTDSQRADTAYQKKVIKDLQDYVNQTYLKLDVNHRVKADRFERLKEMYRAVELSRYTGDDKLLEEAVNKTAVDDQIPYGRLKKSALKKLMENNRDAVHHRKIKLRTQENTQQQLIDLNRLVINDYQTVEQKNIQLEESLRQKDVRIIELEEQLKIAQQTANIAIDENTRLKKENTELKTNSETLINFIQELRTDINSLKIKSGIDEQKMQILQRQYNTQQKEIENLKKHQLARSPVGSPSSHSGPGFDAYINAHIPK